MNPLFEIYKDGFFDYRSYILKSMSLLELSPSEAIVLIYLLDSYKQGEKVIILNQLETKINIHRSEIVQTLSNLLEREFYQVRIDSENGIASEEFSIEPFFNKLEKIYNEKTPINEDEINKIFKLIQKKSGRLLSPNEYDIIMSLYTEDGYNFEDFNKTIAHLEKARYDISVRNIQKNIEKIDVKINVSSKVQDFLKKMGVN